MFQESDLIQLRPTSVNDLDFVCDLESQEENAQFIIPWTKEAHLKALDNSDIQHLIIEAKTTNIPVGYIINAGLENQHGSLELMRITIAEKGKGYGKESFRLIKDWAFNTHKAHRLWLDVKINNTRAIKLYTKQGFTIEGTLRECLKGQVGYESLHVMSMLEQEFRCQAPSVDILT